MSLRTNAPKFRRLCLLSRNQRYRGHCETSGGYRLDRLGCWARKWGIRFQPVKCNIMQITRKRIKKINASYNLEGTVLDNVENIKYLGITITNNLKWSTHVSNICTRANRILGFLTRTLSACPHDVKESPSLEAYKLLLQKTTI